MAIKENIRTNKTLKFISSISEKDIFWVFSFTILTAIAAQITIPVKPVPFTLQTLVVVLAGAVLGAKKGAYSQLIYLGLGSIGLPVFAQIPDNAIGIARLFGPTGGYLLAFPAAAFLTGYFVAKNDNYFTTALSMFAGNILIIIIGTLYLDIFFIHNLSESLKAGAIIFSLWTVIKVFVAATIYFGIKKAFSYKS